MKIQAAALVGTVIVGVLGGEAMAACTGTGLTQAQIGQALRGKTACAVRGNDSWQELHSANGDLVDYKKGPTDPVDPSKKVGTWSLQGTGTDPGTVTYNYGTGGTYAYSVFSNGGSSYSFCAGGVELPVTVIDGSGPCPNAQSSSSSPTSIQGKSR